MKKKMTVNELVAAHTKIYRRRNAEARKALDKINLIVKKNR